MAANGSTFSATRRPSDNLLRLVHDPHAAVSDFADQAVIAERLIARRADRAPRESVHCAAETATGGVEKIEAVETAAEFVGDVGVAREEESAIGGFAGVNEGGVFFGGAEDAGVGGGRNPPP